MKTTMVMLALALMGCSNNPDYCNSSCYGDALEARLGDGGIKQGVSPPDLDPAQSQPDMVEHSIGNEPSYPDGGNPHQDSIVCGGATCDSNTQYCCANGLNDGCKPIGNTQCTVTEFSCDDSDDCPTGSVCCLTTPTPGTARCTTVPECPTFVEAGLQAPVFFCAGDNECPSKQPFCCGWFGIEHRNACTDDLAKCP